MIALAVKTWGDLTDRERSLLIAATHALDLLGGPITESVPPLCSPVDTARLILGRAIYDAVDGVARP